ncbi:hypothetical protein PUN28_019700 [Cardiocondyla obscurior]|uniref:MULE transposase domain-containing protein n=1 Tax=Cardiocondyla obscurior TaxID=286306 RepID=A0AAW2ECV7_9HYME
MIVPRVLLMSQLYTIHTRYHNAGIAVVFILCKNRSSNMFLMTDYENAAMKMLKEKFPAAEAHGCWFHCNQALLRKWKRLGLINTSRNILSMTMTMALIPSYYFEKALSYIQIKVDQMSHAYPALNEFLTYVRKSWLPLASKVSVFDCPVRTNNITESLYSVAKRKFNNLGKLIADEEIKLKRLRVTEINNRTNAKTKCRDNKILEAQRNLTAGRIDLNHFLRLFSDRYKTILQIELLNQDNTDINNALSVKDNNHTTCTDINETTIYEAQQTVTIQTPLRDITNRKVNNNLHIEHQTRTETLFIIEEGR